MLLNLLSNAIKFTESGEVRLCVGLLTPPEPEDVAGSGGAEEVVEKAPADWPRFDGIDIDDAAAAAEAACRNIDAASAATHARRAQGLLDRLRQGASPALTEIARRAEAEREEPSESGPVPTPDELVGLVELLRARDFSAIGRFEALSVALRRPFGRDAHAQLCETMEGLDFPAAAETLERAQRRVG